MTGHGTAPPPPPPPPAPQPGSDLRMRLDAALAAYRTVLEEFRAGRIGAPEMQRRALAAGLVVAGDEAWIFDAERGTWLRYDGLQVRSLEELAAEA